MRLVLVTLVICFLQLRTYTLNICNIETHSKQIRALKSNPHPVKDLQNLYNQIEIKSDKEGCSISSEDFVAILNSVIHFIKDDRIEAIIREFMFITKNKPEKVCPKVEEKECPKVEEKECPKCPECPKKSIFGRNCPPAPPKEFWEWKRNRENKKSESETKNQPSQSNRHHHKVSERPEIKMVEDTDGFENQRAPKNEPETFQNFKNESFKKGEEVDLSCRLISKEELEGLRLRVNECAGNIRTTERFITEIETGRKKLCLGDRTLEDAMDSCKFDQNGKLKYLQVVTPYYKPENKQVLSKIVKSFHESKMQVDALKFLFPRFQRLINGIETHTIIQSLQLSRKYEEEVEKVVSRYTLNSYSHIEKEKEEEEKKKMEEKMKSLKEVDEAEFLQLKKDTDNRCNLLAREIKTKFPSQSTLRLSHQQSLDLAKSCKGPSREVVELLAVLGASTMPFGYSFIISLLKTLPSQRYEALGKLTYLVDGKMTRKQRDEFVDLCSVDYGRHPIYKGYLETMAVKD